MRYKTYKIKDHLDGKHLNLTYKFQIKNEMSDIYKSSVRSTCMYMKIVIIQNVAWQIIITQGSSAMILSCYLS